MKRRSAIKTISLGVGYTISIGAMTTLVTGCSQDPSKAVFEDWQPAFMSDTEIRMVEKILNVLLPATDSPGARDLKIVHIVDNIVNKIYKKKDQEDFRSSLARMAEVFQEDHGVAAADISSKHVDAFMEKYMQPLSEEDEQAYKDFIYTSKEDISESQMPDYLFKKGINNVRSLGISTFFATKTIATEYLNYDPIPGAYLGCIPASEVGNTWAL